MRLVCPNCGAQYEVPDDVIPETGRDVQCSNCGDTWFQKHPSQDRDLADELDEQFDEAHWEAEAATAGPEPEDAPEPAYEEPDEYEEEYAAEPDDEPEPEPEPDYEPEPDDEPEPGPDYAAEPEDEHWEDGSEAETGDWNTFDEDDDRPAAPAARGLSPEVREVLREEAEHERQVRAAESGGLETQPDLGLEDPGDEASRREREARVRMAKMRGMSEEEAFGEAGLAAHATRRDLLPDIEEINSTLRKDSDRVAQSEIEELSPPAPVKPKSFSRGFSTMFLIVVLFLLLYVYADKLANLVPAAEGLLDAYVGMVDTLRLWLDKQVLALTHMLDGLTSGGDSGS